MCNAPKYGRVEQRTGFGGGYMERDEVVEYVKRDDSDSEYDEVSRPVNDACKPLTLRMQNN
jgi:hypothetical protein